MKNFMDLIVVLIVSVFFLSCSQNISSNSRDKIKPENKVQVIDFLKGKSKAEILQVKYKELKASCILNTVKVTKGQLSFFSTDSAVLIVESSGKPIDNPSENSVTYDLKLQQSIDKELTQDVHSKIISQLDGINLSLEILFKPLVFEPAINLDINQKKYVMKYTPVLSYSAVYELAQAGGSSFATTEAKVYEKITGQKNSIVTVKLGEVQYNFILECQLDRAINDENKDLAVEFENQWVSVN